MIGDERDDRNRKNPDMRALKKKRAAKRSVSWGRVWGNLSSLLQVGRQGLRGR